MKVPATPPFDPNIQSIVTGHQNITFGHFGQYWLIWPVLTPQAMESNSIKASHTFMSCEMRSKTKPAML